MTYSQMAAKFGWPSIIISILLTPFALLWSKLIAFPVWLDLIYKHKPFYVLKSSYKYPNEEDFVRKNVYTGAVQHSIFPPMVDALNGFNFHADVEGGKWIESFYGFIHCLDMTTHDDRMVLETNSMTVFPANVFIEYPKGTSGPGVHEHRVRFYFPIKGPNMLNPAMWATLFIPLSGVMIFANNSIVRYFKENGVILHNTNLPKEEDSSSAREDGSIPFVPASADTYGSIS